MYSMVLMAALTTGTHQPDFGCRGSCHGCWGCRGGCHGCWGGCYGCWGGCHGCWGGCYGCWGGCYGCWGCGGCYGWGGWGGGGYAYAPALGYAAPTMLAYGTLPAAAPTTTRSMYPDSSTANRATIVLHLPELATLTVDGKPTTSTSATRQFYSPPLEPGKTYHYTFEARMERDGKTVKAEKSVDVTAGDRQEITITLPELNPPPKRQQSAKPEEKPAIPERRRADL